MATLPAGLTVTPLEPAPPIEIADAPVGAIVTVPAGVTATPLVVEEPPTVNAPAGFKVVIVVFVAVDEARADHEPPW